jgi:hypothetical protein
MIGMTRNSSSSKPIQSIAAMASPASSENLISPRAMVRALR